MDYILTENGKKYMARVNAQMMQMHLVRVETGNGFTDRPETLAELTEARQTLQIESIETDGSVTVIHCLLTNIGLHEGYQLRQAGVYAHDSVDNKDMLIFVGQDAAGEWIPPIEEREVEILHNIGVKVSSTREIVFDLSVNDFVRKGYLEDQLRERGRVLIGGVDTPINPGEILLVLEDGFETAGITNIRLGTGPPSDTGDNWGRVKILDGKLTAGEMPEKDTTFFAKMGGTDYGK